jgi:hypothetical protein
MRADHRHATTATTGMLRTLVRPTDTTVQTGSRAESLSAPVPGTVGDVAGAGVAGAVVGVTAGVAGDTVAASMDEAATVVAASLAAIAALVDSVAAREADSTERADSAAPRAEVFTVAVAEASTVVGVAGSAVAAVGVPTVVAVADTGNRLMLLAPLL